MGGRGGGQEAQGEHAMWTLRVRFVREGGVQGRVRGPLSGWKGRQGPRRGDRRGLRGVSVMEKGRSLTHR